jgi:group I intron endonuclease
MGYSMSHYVTGIYRITNTINNHCYIGSAINIEKRIKNHFWKLRKNIHHSPYLQSAYNKYNNDIFIIDTLLYCDKTDLLFYEQRAIDIYKPEYNVCLIAGSTLGRKCLDKTKRLISTANKNRVVSNETRKKLSICSKGKTLSDEHKIKISLANKNKFVSEETKNKISHSKQGIVVSDETREKMSQSHKNMSPEKRQKIELAKQSPECKEKRKATWERKKREKEEKLKMLENT